MKKLSPAQILTFSFLVLILTGAILLTLPIASTSGESTAFLDALFTSTSAVCVTGLVVVTTVSHWTLFGKIVIMLLIQCGGLGLMTILTLIMTAMHSRISLKNRMIIQAAYNEDKIGGMIRLTRRVVKYTLIIEGTGALLLAIFFFLADGGSVLQAIWKGIFHAVSAFCNAGFDIIGTENLTPYRTNIGINIVIMTMIILGGLGFVVLADIKNIFGTNRRHSWKRSMKKLRLHTKITLTMTVILLVGGTIMFLILEWGNPETLKDMPLIEKVGAALFQSVTLRTAGFNTINQGGLTDAAEFFSCILMLIGGSSAGTAGGMKVVSVGVIIIAMISVLRGREQITAFGRALPVELLQSALTVASTMLFIVFGATMILYFAELSNPVQHSFLDVLFECCSATGTVGNTAGLTQTLSHTGKIVIILCMFLGRVGPVTVMMALRRKKSKNDNERKYIEERVMIG